MRFVPIKTIEQQGGLVLHRTRQLLVRQQTATINSIRAYLAEFGIVAPAGTDRARRAAAQSDTWRWPPANHGFGRQRCRSQGLPLGAELSGVM